MRSPKLQKKIRVAVSAIDLELSLPYQWALLRTYAEEDPKLECSVIWEKPLHFSVRTVRKILENPKQLIQMYHLNDVTVLGLSCYTWSTASQMQIAEVVRKANPQCIIIAGGPDLDYHRADIFDQFPNIDAIVKGDGEIPFRHILRSVLEGNTDFSTIPGLIIRRNSASIDTGPSEVYREFERSPWIHCSKELEAIAYELRSKKEPIRITYETNRGCPYSCTYCNWGSSTMSKIRMFNFENIVKEIKWFDHVGIDQILLADANFGILPRDTEISVQLSQLGGKEPCPSIIFYSAKNKSDRVVEIAKNLFQAGLLKVFSFGVQSTDLETLAAIGRSNMRLKEQKQIVENLQLNNIPVAAQLILGCPGDHPESWRRTVTDMLEIGISESHAFRFQILPNTPADKESYRALWKLDTMRRKGEISGYRAEYIRACSTYSRTDYVEMELFFLVTESFTKVAALNQIVNALRRQFSLSFKAIFDAIFDEFFCASEYSFAYENIRILRNYITDYINLESDDQFFSFIVLSIGGSECVYHPKSFLSLKIKQNLDSFLMELQDFFARKFSFQIEYRYMNA